MKQVDKSEYTPKRNILIIGPLPPPFGGVSVHLDRLIKLLKDECLFSFIDDSNKKKVEIFNFRSLYVIKYVRLVSKCEMAHIHSGHFMLRFIHYVICKFFKKKVIISLHSYPNKKRKQFESLIDNYIINRSDKVVFVSEEIAKKFKRKNYFIRDAFIPPFIEDEDLLPKSISNWIQERKKLGYTVCCANASSLKHHNGEDLYGLDLCIQAAQHIKSSNNKVAFIFVICESGGSCDIIQYKELLKKYFLTDSFLIIESPLSFVNLIIKSDVVLRPTNTDGDALTVREGLLFGKFVIASNVVRRPEGTYLFETRNYKSLAEAIIYSINATTEKTGLSNFYRQTDECIKFYNNVLYK